MPAAAKRRRPAPKKSAEWSAPAWNTSSLGVEVAHVTSRGIVTLTNNTIYRLGDVVAQRGHLWLFSALAILSRPAFRRTLLRDLLSRLASHDGTRLSDMPVAAAERLAARNWTCYNATFGGKLSWNGLPLTRHWNCALWDAMQPALPFLTFERDYCRIVRALAAIVRSHLGQNDTSCRAAPANTAAVHVRMGDKRDVWQPIKSSIGDRGLGLAVPLHQQAASLTCTNSTLVMVGLINYGPERMPSGSRAFAYSDHIQQESELYVRQLWRVLDRCVGTGGRWRWRSDASADADLCFLATADYFVRLTRGPPNAARAAFAPSAARAAPVPRASRTARVPPPSPAPPPPLTSSLSLLQSTHFFNPSTPSILSLLPSTHFFNPPTSSVLGAAGTERGQLLSTGPRRKGGIAGPGQVHALPALWALLRLGLRPIPSRRAGRACRGHVRECARAVCPPPRPRSLAIHRGDGEAGAERAGEAVARPRRPRIPVISPR